jgi:hypothetical protein
VHHFHAWRHGGEQKKCGEPKLTDELEEYRKRVVPASDEEIVALAEGMWANTKLRAIFERVGYEGDFSDDEAAAVSAAIDVYRQGRLWDRDELHLRLAPCLIRQVAAGMIDKLDSSAAREFLADRRVDRDGGVMVRPRKLTAGEAMDFASAVQRDPDAWRMIQRLKDFPNCLPHEIDTKGTLSRFETNFIAKYGLFNRSGFGPVIGMLRTIARGEIASLNAPEALESLRRTDSIRDGE